MLETVIKRYAFPEWCEVEVEPDDSQIEYARYRELLKILYLSLAKIKGLQQHLLTRVEQEVDSLQVNKVPVKQAEVSLMLVFELYHSLAGKQPE